MHRSEVVVFSRAGDCQRKRKIQKNFFIQDTINVANPNLVTACNALIAVHSRHSKHESRAEAQVISIHPGTKIAITKTLVSHYSKITLILNTPQNRWLKWIQTVRHTRKFGKLWLIPLLLLIQISSNRPITVFSRLIWRRVVNIFNRHGINSNRLQNT